jgi:Mn2+/Fe2+ NRAMP family transporter
MSTSENINILARTRSAVLDEAHVGDIQGALGTIAEHDIAPRRTWMARLRTLLAIIGPGLIVMVGDNDAGAFGTYTQAGQNYGTTLLWTLALLIPVLYVNQEMVLRLGAVSGVGHARLIFERFGKFWGAFSVIDLFILSAHHRHGVHRHHLRAAIFRRTEDRRRLCSRDTDDGRRQHRQLQTIRALCRRTLFSEPAARTGARRDSSTRWRHRTRFRRAGLAHGREALGRHAARHRPCRHDCCTMASYVIDKRITPRFMKYEKADLWIGIAFVMIGAVAMIAFSAALFAGRPEFGNFTDAGGVLTGLQKYVGQTAATLFAVALLDASIIGAAAVSLATAYAAGDVFEVRHSLHRSVFDAKGFYFVYFALIALAAALVLIPGSPLGLLTEAVQTLAGVLLPSATVFLLLLCNDKAVLGPWANSKRLNLFTGAVVAILIVLSIILTASTVFPDISGHAIMEILVGGLTLSAVGFLTTQLAQRLRGKAVPHSQRNTAPKNDARDARDTWRMPPLDELPSPQLTLATRVWMGTLRGYLLISVGLVIFKVVQVAMH